MARLEQPQISPVSQLPATPQKAMSMEQELRERIANADAEREAQLEVERERIKEMLGRKTQVDLSPLMALASSISGSDAPMKGYKAPQDSGEEIAGAMRNLASGQRGLSQDRIANLKTMLQDKRDAASGRDQRQMVALENSAFDKSQKQFGKLQNDANTYREDSANVIDAITPRNGMVTAGRVSQALAKFSRLMGEKGVLTDQDLGRTLERTIGRDLERFRTYLSGQPEGALVDAATVANMQQAMKVATKAFTDSYNKRVSFYKNTWDKHPVVGVKFKDDQGWGNDMYKQALMNAPEEPSFADLGSDKSGNYVKAGNPVQGETVNAAPRKRTVAEIQAEIDSLK